MDEPEEDLSDLTTVKVFARRERKLNEKKELIGTTASKLIENPETNVNFDIKYDAMHIQCMCVDWLIENTTFTVY